MLKDEIDEAKRTVSTDTVQITIGEVLRFVEEGKKGKRAGTDAFTDLWKRVDAAISGILDRTTFAEHCEHRVERG